MVTVIDVLKYMSSLGHHFNGETQAHKLLYYAQAWTLAWDGKPLFDEPIEAWKNGPVVPSVRHLNVALIGCYPGDLDTLSPQQKANVEAVISYYGRMTGRRLIQLTHDEAPWKEARGDCAPGSPSSDAIQPDAMRREYTRQSVQGKGPKRALGGNSGVQFASNDAVAEAASRTSKRWKHTLELLAQ